MNRSILVAEFRRVESFFCGFLRGFLKLF